MGALTTFAEYIAPASLPHRWLIAEEYASSWAGLFAGQQPDPDTWTYYSGAATATTSSPTYTARARNQAGSCWVGVATVRLDLAGAGITPPQPGAALYAGFAHGARFETNLTDPYRLYTVNMGAAWSTVTLYGDSGAFPTEGLVSPTGFTLAADVADYVEYDPTAGQASETAYVRVDHTTDAAIAYLFGWHAEGTTPTGSGSPVDLVTDAIGTWFWAFPGEQVLDLRQRQQDHLRQVQRGSVARSLRQVGY